MPLDRQSIEKRDFPIGRRGYEADAVDAHLASVADEFDALQRQSRRRSSESLAQAASEQVRAIVDAAERSASDIERGAEEDAAEIRAEASEAAERTRQEAVKRAREQVGRVTEATSGMIQRVEAMRGELDGLLESLRTGANRVSADLSLLESSMGDLSEATAPRGAAEPSARAAPLVEPEPELEPALVAEPEPTPELETFENVAVEVVEEDVVVELPPAPAAAQASPRQGRRRGRSAPESVEVDEPSVTSDVEAGPEGADGDVEGARLIALNMALNGQSREETDRYLSENFDLSDRQGLLDEVYASVEG